MENFILLRAGMKRHRGSLAGILLLTLLAAAALGTVMTVWTHSGAYIHSEMERAGFGELTAWAANIADLAELESSIEALPEIERVETQRLVYASYRVNGQESDSEGQLIPYDPGENRYRFFRGDLSGHDQPPDQIAAGEVYVSPSLISMFGAAVGDEIAFPLARAGKNITLTVKGFYEDPFMGSAMIGMKGFLISEADYRAITSALQDAGIDALARSGAMLHMFPKEDGGLTAAALNSILNERTALAEVTEAVHSRSAMEGFMLILQDAFSGLMIAFAAVLLLVVSLILGHSISGAIASDFVNMGILKTIGITAMRLRLLQLLQYLIPIVLGLMLGASATVPISRLVLDHTLTTTGVLIPSGLPLPGCMLTLAAILMLLTGFILLRTRRISKITPLEAIRGETDWTDSKRTTHPAAFGRWIPLRLAARQLISGKSRYAGAFAAAVLLVFFASLVGRIDSWLGADGKGMMDAFNPADHDLGVQSFGELTREDFESTIRQYTDITDTYRLAMPAVAVNGISYTANVIDQPDRFHIIEGRSCAADHEIVLTEFVAANLGVSVGDTVTVRGDSGSGAFIVVGIYSCANDMGDNIGLSQAGYLRIGRDHPSLWCWHYFLADPSRKAEIIQSLEARYGGDVHVHENTWPGLLGIIAAMRALVVVMYAVAVIFILIVTVMSGSRLLAAEQKDLGIYKAIGFPSNSLRLTFALRFGLTAALGAVIGVVLAAIATDPLVSAVMKLAGISSFSAHPNLIEAVCPAVIVVLTFLAFAWLYAGKIRRVPLSVLVSE